MAKGKSKVDVSGGKQSGGKRGAPKKAMHPTIDAALKQKQKIEALPDDYDLKKHAAPKREWFKSEATFFDWKASKLESTAQKLRKKAEIARQFGDTETRKKANKLNKLKDKLAELQAELEAEGVDISLLDNAPDEEDND